MKTILTVSLLIFSLISPAFSATDCGHLNIEKCTAQNLNPTTVLENSKYQHFGMVAKGFDGILSVVYREGVDHGANVNIAREGDIFFSQSSDNGNSWSTPTKLSQNGGDDVDYRDPNLGYSDQGTLITTYVRKDRSTGTLETLWVYRISVNNGRSWSDEAEFGISIPNGLPYGRIVPIPSLGGNDENSNKVLATGYYSKKSEDYLGNWLGTVITLPGTSSSSIEWTELSPTFKTNRAEDGVYPYTEHSVLPLTNNVWIAASRGPNSITIFKTIDAGVSWNKQGEGIRKIDGSLPYPSGGAQSRLVAPMLDVMNVDGQKYLILLYTQRPCDTAGLSTSGGPCSVLKIGKNVQQFIDNGTDQIAWSDDVGISPMTNTLEGGLSGYQSGVFLNNDITKYFHLEFHEKSGTDADIQSTILDFKTILPGLSYVDPTVPEFGKNMVTGSYFKNLTNSPLQENTFITGGNWLSLADGWRVVPSGAKYRVDVDISDGGGHPSHLHLRLEPGSGNTNAYAGINQDIYGGYGKIREKEYAELRFYAKTDPNKTLKIYYYIHSLSSALSHPLNKISSENITIDATWKEYKLCFLVPDLGVPSSSNIRLTIGYQNVPTPEYGNLSNDLTIDNVLLKPTNVCNSSN